MNTNQENLQGIVSKLKEQGIKAGEEEKQRIIEKAKDEAKKLLDTARQESEKVVQEAKNSAAQIEKNSQAAIQQASRDVIEGTKIAILDHLKTVFGEQCESLLTEEQYLKEILNVVVETLPGDKTIQVSPDVLPKMEAFLLAKSLSDKVELKPLATQEAKITVCADNQSGVEYVVNAGDIEASVFSLLNKDLVQRITQTKEG